MSGYRNIMFDASALDQGRQARFQEQRNALLMEQTQQQMQDSAAARPLFAAAVSGDRNALSRLAALDPGKAQSLLSFQNSQQDQASQMAGRRTEIAGRWAFALQAAPPEQRPALWARAHQAAAELGMTLPAEVPDDAGINAFIAASTPAATSATIAGNRIVPLGGGGGASYPSGAPAAPYAGLPPATGTPQGSASVAPNTPAQRVAVDELKTRRDTALATLSGPALDAELNAMNEQAGVAMGRRPGGSTTTFQGAGGGAPMTAPSGQAAAQPAAAPAPASRAASLTEAPWPPPGYRPAGRANDQSPIIRGDEQLMINPRGQQEWVRKPEQITPLQRAQLQRQEEALELQRRGAERQDQAAQRAEEAARRAAENAGVPAGYRRTADGKGLEAVPGGPADPNSVHGKAPVFTEGQANAALYVDRMKEAETTLDKFPQGQGRVDRLLSAAPLVGNNLVSSEYQQIDQAQRNFINATLRRESGAVISPDEFDNARKQYFPQPGDQPEVLAQKASNRRTAISGIERAAGPAYQRQQQTAAPQPQAAAPSNAPAVGAVEDGYRFKGGNPGDPSAWERVQ